MDVLSALERQKRDDSDDGRFYDRPRYVTHADDAFCQRLTTLYDGMRLTSPAAGARTLTEFTTNASNDEGRFYPIPDVGDGPIYNVVEIRVTVW